MARSDPRRAARRLALRRGVRAEWMAAMAMRLKGYRIVARNFRCRCGEIDIVARKRNDIAFVEVKARALVEDGLDAVGFEAQRRIADAAEIWIARQPDAEILSWRFDIVVVLPRRWPRHFADAF
jgi:putative endonuclease